MFFIFQAEDGIRDVAVTGVQTCALPISEEWDTHGRLRAGRGGRMMTPPVTERMPLRICSLLPSATEIVFALGLNDHLVGVTHECDFPPEASRLPIVTRSSLRHGTRDSLEIHHHISAALHTGSSIYTLDQELLERLDPDLILTQELCDVCAVSYGLVKQAAQRLEGKHRVLSLEPTTLSGILATIE